MFSVVEETDGRDVLVVPFDDDDVDSVRCEPGLTFGEEHSGRSLGVQESVARRSKLASWPNTGT